jgi:hypothetical protein
MAVGAVIACLALQLRPIVNWSNPLQEAKLLLLEQSPTSKAKWLPSLQEYVDNQMFGTFSKFTRGGLWYIEQWGSLRNAAMTAHVALRTAAFVDSVSEKEKDIVQLVWAHYARCFAKQQMAYIMGSSGRSFVTGWGDNPPKRPHHRNAICGYVLKGQNCTMRMFHDKKTVFANVLPGGLVSGPDLQEKFNDDHTRPVESEVATDFNAALVSGAPPCSHHWAPDVLFLPLLPPSLCLPCRQTFCAATGVGVGSCMQARWES